MRQRLIWAAFVVLCASSSLLLARPGTVTTKDNNSFDGDVTEDQTKGTVTIMMHGVPVNVKMANVESIVYVDQVDAAVRQKLAVMGAKDVKGRIELAQYAFDHHALVTARDVLIDAQRIEPENPDVRDLLERVKTQLRSQATTKAAPVINPPTAAVIPSPVAASQPFGTTQPVEKAGLVTRQVTPAEVNYIRESEIRENDTVRVRLDGDVRRRFADYINMPYADFNKLAPVQQAFMILDKGKPDMKEQVKLLSDPPAITNFRKSVLRPLIVGCATGKCHGGPQPAAFRLYPQETEAAIYTNFVVISKYSTQVANRSVSLLDRQNPEQSLLLSYMLPPAIADVPHPEVKGYHGAVRTREDPRYVAVLAWIRDDLQPLAPDYSVVNLSAPPTTQPIVAGSVSP